MVHDLEDVGALVGDQRRQSGPGRPGGRSAWCAGGDAGRRRPDRTAGCGRTRLGSTLPPLITAQLRVTGGRRLRPTAAPRARPRRRLGDRLGALHQQHDGLGDGFFGHGHHVVDQRANDRQRALAGRACEQAVGDGRERRPTGRCSGRGRPGRWRWRRLAWTPMMRTSAAGLWRRWPCPRSGRRRRWAPRACRRSVRRPESRAPTVPWPAMTGGSSNGCT